MFRDPREWIAGLKLTRDLEPEVLISAAARPVVGKEECASGWKAIWTGQVSCWIRPFAAYSAAKAQDELRHLVRFPDYLDEVPNNLQNYGEVSSYPPAIYYQAVGWYDNDAGTSSRLPRWRRPVGSCP